MHQKVPYQDRYYGSDFYQAVYRQSEIEEVTLKSRPEMMKQINQVREELGNIPKCRTLVEDMTMADGQKVGRKNGSIFREYLKTSKVCQSEYHRDISKYEVNDKSISEVNTKYANGIDIN
tara:strand:+ start:40 stop:399 length:360 start_codon:yes stop_codon:yes gene_type:complete